jgi:hypothetical protein
MVLEDSPELEVWLLNQWAGTLRQRGGELQFQYSERWLAQPQAITQQWRICRSGTVSRGVGNQPDLAMSKTKERPAKKPSMVLRRA